MDQLWDQELSLHLGFHVLAIMSVDDPIFLLAIFATVVGKTTNFTLQEGEVGTSKIYTFVMSDEGS